MNKESHAKGILDYIHFDVWGPQPIRSHGDARYFVTFVDDYSRKIWVYFMWEKSEVFVKFKEWKAGVENQTGRKIKYLCSDNRGEYRDGRFMEFYKQQGITHHSPWRRLCSRMTQRKGWTELSWRERCMRLHTGLPGSFWAEFVNHAASLVNRSPSKLLNSRYVEEVWSAKDIDYSTLNVFGCKAYIHIPSDERNKLKPKSLEYIFSVSKRAWRATGHGIRRTRRRCWVEMSYLMKGLEQKMLIKKRFMKRTIPKFFCHKKNQSQRIILRWSKHQESMKHRKCNKH